MGAAGSSQQAGRARPQLVRNVGLAATLALVYNSLHALNIGQHHASLVCFLGALATSLATRLAVREETARRAAHALVAVAWLVIVGSASDGPGFYHGGTVYFLTLGPAAVAMLGTWPGVAWGLSGALGAALLAAAEAQGLMGLEHHASSWIWFDLIDLGVVHVLLTAFTLFFTHEAHRFAARLESQNAALAEENEQRRAAVLEARRATRARSQFLATISHEIRTPMNSILGMASEINGGELVPEQRERLELLEGSAKSLLGLLSDLLDYSRLESGKVALEERPFSLVRLAEEVVRLHRPLATGTVELVLVTGALQSRSVRGDELRCRQILQNLVSNALKFTRAGSIEVRLRSVGPERVRLEVQDTGPGIAEEALQRLGEPFEQADPGIARQHGGTGLGLAIVRRLASAMGGSLEIRSELGVGSTFSTELHLPPAQLEELAGGAVVPELAGGLKVLVCEDNVVNQRVILGQLRRLAVACDIVDNGQNAIERAGRERYAALILDYQLPDIDGPEVARIIRQREGSGRRLPIIGLSANAMADDRQTSLAAGMDDYLTKPVSAEVLRRALARWTAEATSASQGPQR